MPSMVATSKGNNLLQNMVYRLHNTHGAGVPGYIPACLGRKLPC